MRPSLCGIQKPRGFTVIELLVVLAAIGLLLSIAAPRYLRHLETARDVTLRQDLYQLRDAIDKFRGDRGRYPATLEELVTEHYLRSVPVDPVTQRSDSWILLAPNKAGEPNGTGVFDVRSGAQGVTTDGSSYGNW